MNKSNSSVTLLSVYYCVLMLLGGCAQVDRCCAGLVPPETKDEVFVQWVIANGAELKQQGLWNELTKWSKEAIAIARDADNNEAAMMLSAELASTYFYLGDVKECERSAREAWQIATKLSNPKMQVRSLCLISAACRANGDVQSVTVAKEALLLCNQSLPDEKALKAKVLFNLGAAESDVTPNQLESAASHLKEAGSLFEEADNNHEVFRVGLRLVNVQYLQSCYEKAEETITGLQVRSQPLRSRMLYFYQLAKVQHRLNKWHEAEGNNNTAYQLATQLKASKDIEKISSLMKAINDRIYIDN